MSTKSNSSRVIATASSWNDFKMASGGRSSDIKVSAAQIRSSVNSESKIFTDSSIYDGGTKKSQAK